MTQTVQVDADKLRQIATGLSSVANAFTEMLGDGAQAQGDAPIPASPTPVPAPVTNQLPADTNPPVKRGRGRPKGSKNKKTLAAQAEVVSAPVPAPVSRPAAIEEVDPAPREIVTPPAPPSGIVPQGFRGILCGDKAPPAPAGEVHGKITLDDDPELQQKVEAAMRAVNRGGRSVEENGFTLPDDTFTAGCNKV